ncbi:MAG: hypothetical protein HY235_28190 [Acidobacteria bacterium]|nr:hypothetical protein [Acidobacteriota bacterium]
MSRWIRCACCLLIGTHLVLAAEGKPAPPAGITKNVLTNQGVVLLAQAGYSEEFIIDMIHHKQTQFDATTEGLVWLARQGLSERIVRAMVANERKQERTAILPAIFTVTTVPAEPRPASRTNGRPAPQTQVAVPVLVPTPEPSPLSWYVRDWQRERWYLTPNVPLLAAPER